ncbi:hypothetical protein BT67DRAFT_18809 [Trichocladium antarcticum]|uniref:Uncharacterized protein n=1 Tax=Trichocladium antarcticum TaxID=1450529 RepID=A0AAN6UT09_9PEZI|nr:hypothetical protein BT67DRAFT_18809 [Trichocladium antarcticum]
MLRAVSSTMQDPIWSSCRCGQTARIDNVELSDAKDNYTAAEKSHGEVESETGTAQVDGWWSEMAYCRGVFRQACRGNRRTLHVTLLHPEPWQGRLEICPSATFEKAELCGLSWHRRFGSSLSQHVSCLLSQSADAGISGPSTLKVVGRLVDHETSPVGKQATSSWK